MTHFQVLRCQEIRRDIKTLLKKYPNAGDDIRAAERLLESGKQLPHAERYPGFGTRTIFKARFVNQDLGNQGLSSGYRILYEMCNRENGITCYIIIHVYCKKGGPDEKDIKREVNKRIRSSAYPAVTS